MSRNESSPQLQGVEVDRAAIQNTPQLESHHPGFLYHSSSLTPRSALHCEADQDISPQTRDRPPMQPQRKLVPLTRCTNLPPLGLAAPLTSHHQQHEPPLLLVPAPDSLAPRRKPKLETEDSSYWSDAESPVDQGELRPVSVVGGFEESAHKTAAADTPMALPHVKLSRRETAAGAGVWPPCGAAGGVSAAGADEPQPPPAHRQPALDCRTPSLESRAGSLRPVVIDGNNVAMSHGNKQVFSCRGIQLAVQYFVARGHHQVTVFVPSWRSELPRADTPISEQRILTQLQQQRRLVFTPSREVDGRRINCYDDRYILQTAVDTDGVVVSNDNFRDLIKEKCFKKVIEERILMYSFVNDRFMPPDDPLGRRGPCLDTFLRRPSIAPDDSCPYGKRCTYGNKCKYAHPDRGSQGSRSPARQRNSANQSPARKKNSRGSLSLGGRQASRENLSSASTDSKSKQRPKRPLSRTRVHAHLLGPARSADPAVPSHVPDTLPAEVRSNSSPVTAEECGSDSRETLAAQRLQRADLGGFDERQPVRYPAGVMERQLNVALAESGVDGLLRLRHLQLGRITSDPCVTSSALSPAARPHSPLVRQAHTPGHVSSEFIRQTLVQGETGWGSEERGHLVPPRSEVSRISSAPEHGPRTTWSPCLSAQNSASHAIPHVPLWHRMNSSSDPQLNYSFLRHHDSAANHSFGHPVNDANPPPHSLTANDSLRQPPLGGSVVGAEAYPTAPADVVSLRRNMYWHLSALFPEEKVMRAMALLPSETDAELICAQILRL